MTRCCRRPRGLLLSLPLWLPTIALAETGSIPVAEDAGVAAAPAPSVVVLAYDDGDTDSLNSLTTEYAMEFEAPAEVSRLQRISVCLNRGTVVDAGTIRLNVYEEGLSGPGALLRSFEAAVGNVSPFFAGSFHAIDVPGGPLEVPRRFYVGVEDDAPDFSICADHGDGSDDRPVFYEPLPNPWLPFGGPGRPKALMIRPTVDTLGPCDAGADAVHLLGDRFRVDACWRTPDGKSGTATLAQEQGTGATLWFFMPSNPELFVKVHDACVPFDRYWFFGAGLTNVGVTVTVTDTLRGVSRTYASPLDTPFRSIQDTGSFATCP